MAEKVSGVGAGSERTDKNLSDRLAKINREAKIQNAPGAGYAVNKDLSSIAGGASTNVPQPNVEPATVTNANIVDMFAPGSQGRPLTDGVDYGTPGVGSESLQPAMTGPDQLGILARALYTANPTPQNRRLLEAFIEEGR